MTTPLHAKLAEQRKLKRYRLTGRLLSPIHIGTGNEIDPMELVLRNELFHRVRLENLLTRMNDLQRAEFHKAVNRADFAQIRQIVAAAFDPASTSEIRYSAKGFGSFGNEFVEKTKTNQNQFLIAETQRNADGSLRIPGSSIKGAIRTAILDARSHDANGLKSLPGHINAGSFENQVLSCASEHNPNNRQMNRDPFRALRIADAALPAEAGRLVCVKNRSIVNTAVDKNAKGVPMQFEVIGGRMLNGAEVRFEAEITLDQWLNGQRQFAAPLVAGEISLACMTFYGVALRDEIFRFHQAFQTFQTEGGKVTGPTSPLFQMLGLKEGEFPLRLGHFSHMESITVRDYRQVKNPKTGKPIAQGTSRSLVDGIYPFGWVICRIEPL